MTYYNEPNTPYVSNDTDGVEFIPMTDAEVAELFATLRAGA